MDSSEEKVPVGKQEYDCVICNQTTASTEDKPMGLAVLVQATSVVGHRRRQGFGDRVILPTCDEEREIFRRDDTLAAEFDRRVEELDRHFDQVSFILVSHAFYFKLLFYYSNHGCYLLIRVGKVVPMFKLVGIIFT